MVNPHHQQLSILKQCKLLQINRSNYYYIPQLESDYNLSLMKIIDAEYLQYPFFGSRQMMRHLNRMGRTVSRHRVRRLMRKMGLMAIYQKPKTSIRNAKHKIYPYLSEE
jgi:putative transposase